MNVISIDWDFVFPDTSPYDWGHKEGMIYIETLWPLRWGNVNLSTRVKANKEMRVNKEHLHFLLDKVIDNIDPFALCIAESHSCLPAFVNKLGVPDTIINYDAHHDAGYGQTKELECGNWALHLKKEFPDMKYEIVYPNWRAQSKEKGAPKYAKVSLMKNAAPPPFISCALFVCRSGAWTPSWEDSKWITFTKLVRKKFPVYFFCQDMALIKRRFDLQQAKDMQRQMNEFRKGGMKNGKT